MNALSARLGRPWKTGRPTSLEIIDAAVVPAALAVATFVAATPWLRVFAVSGAVELLLIAGVASVAIASLAIRIWRQPPVVSYAASVVGLIVLLFAAGGLHPDALWHGLANGPNRAVTEILPVSGDRALLAAPLLLTWLCGTATAELVLRARRSSGMAAVGLGLPLACFVIAYAVSASRPVGDEIGAPVLLVTLVAVALLRHVMTAAGTRQAIVGRSIEADARPPTWRPGVAAGGLALAVAVGLAVAVPTLPAMSRKPASLNRATPLVTAAVVDPVDALAALRDGDPLAPAKVVMQVDTNQPSTGYLGMAVLDDYDGAVWSFDATFRPTGGRVPAPAGASAGVTGSATVRQQVRLDGRLPVPFLPALDRPIEVTGAPVVADASTGMLLPGQPITGATSYTVVSHAPASTLAGIPPADGIGGAAAPSLPATGTVSAADLLLPPNTSTAMATALRFLANLTGQRPAPTLAFLQGVLTSLHADERRVDPALASVPTPTAPPTITAKVGKKGKVQRPTPTTLPPPVGAMTTGGTSLSEVINAVTVNRSATPEQFATLYAMVARYLGVPARVVTGFRMAAGSNSGPVAAGVHQISNRQAWTWVEIPVAGLGWVVADPTPDALTAESVPPPEAVQTSATTLPPPEANAVPLGEINGGHAHAKPVFIPSPKSHHAAWWKTAVPVGAGLLLIAALAGPGLAGVRRLLRRRARHQSEPSQLAVGAWLELLDGLHQAGMSARPGDTSAEVATEAGRHFGPDITAPVREVGALANRAVCSISEPPDQAAAARAWESQESVRRAVHRGLDRRQRARALLSVGSAPRRPSVSPEPRDRSRRRTQNRPG